MIYLDHNASTPVHQSVRDAMWPYVETYYGNPSSSHVMGRKERGAVDHARNQVASLLGAQPDDIIFTSGGTESNNLALQGFFHRCLPTTTHPHPPRGVLITTDKAARASRPVAARVISLLPVMGSFS